MPAALPLALWLTMTGSAGVPPVVTETPSAPHAWAAIAGGELWVCWSAALPPDGRCWHRVHRTDAQASTAVDTGTMALAFAGPSVLWVGTPSEGVRWVVARGDPVLRPVETEREGSGAVLQIPRHRACGPDGWLPVYRAQRWAWIEAPCAETCRAAGLPWPWRPTPARTLAIGLRVLVQLGTRTRTGAPGPARRDVHVLFGVAIDFDPVVGLRRQVRRVARHAAGNRIRAVPTVEPGVLAAREQAALRRVLCEGSAP